MIARPYGEKDIALKTIARPLLESAAHIRNKVNIKVLRPPSFEQFERELNDWLRLINEAAAAGILEHLGKPSTKFIQLFPGICGKA